MKTKRKSILSVFIIFIAIAFTNKKENHVLPNFGSIFVNSNPVGAEIYLNNENTVTIIFIDPKSPIPNPQSRSSNTPTYVTNKTF